MAGSYWARIVPVGAITGLVLVMGSAGALSDMRAQSLVGTWNLLSIYEEDESGQDVLTSGRKPEGQLIVDTTGGFRLQVGGDLLSMPSAPDAANAAAVLVSAHAAVLAYRGRYSLDSGRTIHFHVERGLAPFDPAAQVLLIGDRMELTSSSEQSPTGSNYSHMVWQRVR
jgi:hypothetical protein